MIEEVTLQGQGLFDYTVIVDVQFDEFGRQSISMRTLPEGIPAPDVEKVVDQLHFNIHS